MLTVTQSAGSPGRQIDEQAIDEKQIANSRPYVFLGRGRLSQHLKYYLEEALGHRVLSFSWREWSRPNGTLHIPKEFQNPHAVLLLGRDSQLQDQADFARKIFPEAYYLHCSGSMDIPQVNAWHPAGSFSHTLFPLDLYTSLPFVGNNDSVALEKLIPGIQNPTFRISSTQKPLYHALCVLACNASSILWMHAADRFESDLSLPKNFIHGLLNTMSLNLSREAGAGVTGPLSRGDQATLAKNIEALRGDEFKAVLEILATICQPHYQTATVEKEKDAKYEDPRLSP